MNDCEGIEFEPKLGNLFFFVCSSCLCPPEDGSVLRLMPSCTVIKLRKFDPDGVACL